MKYLFNLLVVLLSAAGLTSCLDDISNARIEYPVNNEKYVGTVFNPVPIADDTIPSLDENFVISYESPLSGEMDIVLNGNNISNFFDFSPDQASADIRDIRQYLLQGKNTLTVNPLKFGPSIVFFLEDEGPEIIITRGQVINSGEDVEIEGYLRDLSAYSSTMKLDLIQIKGYDEQGNVERDFVRSIDINVNEDGVFCACGNDAIDIAGLIVREDWENKGTADDPDWQLKTPGVSLLYSFRSQDVYGYEKELEIIGDSDGKGDSLAIKNAIRLALGDTFIESLRPIIAAALYTALEDEPINITEFGPLNPIKVPLGLITMNANMNRFYMAKGTEAVDNPDEWQAINPGKGTMLLNGFKIKDDDLLAVDMVMTNILVDLTVDLGLLGQMDLGMFIRKVLVKTDAEASAAVKDNGTPTVSVQLKNSDFGLQGIRMTQTKIFGIDISGLANVMMPILEGLIGDLLPAILNPILEENLNKLVVGTRFYRTDLIPADIDQSQLPDPENRENLSAEERAILDYLEANVPYTDIRFDVTQLGTGRIPAVPDYDLLLGLQTKADTGKYDDNVSPVLGTVFNDDPIDPAKVYNGLGTTGTNISMAINSNLLNQMLASIYAIGQMHFTQYKGKTYFGANINTPYDLADPSESIAENGDTRIRLWPDMPPLFDIREVASTGGAANASIHYPSAVFSYDVFDGEQWVTDLELQVDFDLAILVSQDDGSVTFGAAGPPTLNINKMVNYTDFPIPQWMIQNIVDVVLFFGGDFLANEFIVLDLNQIASSLINGKQVHYLDSEDNYILEEGKCAAFKVTNAFDGSGVWGQCDIGDASCDPALTPLTPGGGDGPDIICELVEFVVQTDTVGVIGEKGRNLFFQMGLRNPVLKPSQAIPRFDLDDDGMIDFRDNCSLGQYDLQQSIENTGITLDQGLDEQGEPSPEFERAIRKEANKLLALRYSDSQSENAIPSTADIDWFNYMRKGDAPIAHEELGLYPWLKLLFSNPRQFNSDGDRTGELCEDDFDRDGVYTSNYPESTRTDDIKFWVDNCPNVQQLKANDEIWQIDGSDAYYLATDTNPDTLTGDACD